MISSEDMNLVRDGLFGFTVTPMAWVFGEEDEWDLVYSTDQTSIIFDSFASPVKIFRYEKDIKSAVQYDNNGEPWYNEWYVLGVDIYLVKNGLNFSLQYEYQYTARWGSVGPDNAFSIPGFSFSFMRLS